MLYQPAWEHICASRLVPQPTQCTGMELFVPLVRRRPHSPASPGAAPSSPRSSPPAAPSLCCAAPWWPLGRQVPPADRIGGPAPGARRRRAIRCAAGKDARGGGSIARCTGHGNRAGNRYCPSSVLCFPIRTRICASQPPCTVPCTYAAHAGRACVCAPGHGTGCRIHTREAESFEVLLAPVQRLRLAGVDCRRHLAEVLHRLGAPREQLVEVAARAENHGHRAGQRNERATCGHPSHRPYQEVVGGRPGLRHFCSWRK